MQTHFNIITLSAFFIVLTGCVGDQPGSSSSDMPSSVSISSNPVVSSSQSSEAAVQSSSVSRVSSSSITSSASSRSQAASSAMGLPSDAELVYALNVGAAAAVPLDGAVYNADRFATGGMTQMITDAIEGVEEDALYQSERYGSYVYDIPVSAATYSVRLHFVEMYHSAAEARLFNVSIEGQPVVSELDVFNEVGSKAAYDLVLNNIAVSDGGLTLELESLLDNATLSGIAIYSVDGGQYQAPPEPACTDAQRQTPRRVNYATEFTDQQYFDDNVARAPTGDRGFVIEQASTLGNHTIYRPQTLLDNDSLPIVAWGNGACANDGLSQADFLSEIASHGYIVIANGAPGGGGNNDQHETELIKAIDWAVAENARECSQFYGKLNIDKIATMGWSCGGGMAHYAAVDPRVDTAVALNSGIAIFADRFDYYPRFHQPLAIFNGNSSDVAYNPGLQQYEEVTNVPIYHANHASLGHGDAYFQNNGGDLGQAAVGWLNFQLKDDMSATGRERFFGDNCFMCRSPWTSKHKGF
ncbi:MAG TPA: malectin domain-containing carbohydrate-binding protein [Marinagarivorans sp.]